jgi:hypothetical protein
VLVGGAHLALLISFEDCCRIFEISSFSQYFFLLMMILIKLRAVLLRSLSSKEKKIKILKNCGPESKWTAKI